uniref:Uncharacterized protein n=1 Tax=Nelumbo nucifera TaxID=4432 RepID=A0A822YXX5_NELNU|nr:TPA_asm: hypothetical protein HUJ06_013246 [Nelumbo nucifera]
MPPQTAMALALKKEPIGGPINDFKFLDEAAEKENYVFIPL